MQKAAINTSIVFRTVTPYLSEKTEIVSTIDGNIFAAKFKDS